MMFWLVDAEILSVDLMQKFATADAFVSIAHLRLFFNEFYPSYDPEVDERIKRGVWLIVDLISELPQKPFTQKVRTLRD